MVEPPSEIYFHSVGEVVVTSNAVVIVCTVEGIRREEDHGVRRARLLKSIRRSGERQAERKG